MLLESLRHESLHRGRQLANHTIGLFPGGERGEDTAAGPREPRRSPPREPFQVRSNFREPVDHHGFQIVAKAIRFETNPGKIGRAHV